MSDYIKRKDALKAVDAFIGTDPIADRIKLIPSADVAPVVRCKECKYWNELENGTGSCGRSGGVWWFGTDADDFCSFAERRDND